MSKVAGLWLAMVFALWGGDVYYIDHGRRVELTPLLQPRVASGAVEEEQSRMKFVDERGRKLSIGRRLILKLKPGEQIEEYLKPFALKKLKYYRHARMYLLETSSPRAAIDIANELSQMPGVLFAQPDIATKRSLR